MQALLAPLRALYARPRLRLAVQLAAFAVLAGSLAYAARGSWHEAGSLVRSADRVDLVLALLAIAAYYLAFVIGWQVILRAMGVSLGYRTALRAEMLSMVAKYVPGGVWTPAARVVALRRVNVFDTPLVLGSIALEAGLAAIAGVLVFTAALPTVEANDPPCGGWPGSPCCCRWSSTRACSGRRPGGSPVCSGAARYPRFHSG